MSFPNQQILYQVKQGNEAAFTQLCAYFYLPAVKFCTVILKDKAEAECITERVFANIWNERIELEAAGNFQTYLFLSLKNQIFGQMNGYRDPGFKEQFWNKIKSFHKQQHC